MRTLARFPLLFTRQAATTSVAVQTSAEAPVLLRYLGEVQQRCSRQMQEQQRCIAGLEARIGQLQHELLRRDAEVRALRQRIDAEAAGEVICRTGCLSHDDHWRADEQCRLSGLPCHHAEAAQATEKD